MRSMAFKLAAGFAAVALVGVVIVGILADRLTSTEFGHYLAGNVTQEQRVADYIASLYGHGGGWQAVTPALPTLSRWLGQRMVVADDSGKVAADSSGATGPSTLPNPPSSESLPIVDEGKTVGTLYLLADSPLAAAPGAAPWGWGMMGGQGMMGQGRGVSPQMSDVMQQMMSLSTSPERAFLMGVSRAIWIAGGIALVVAVLIGLVISRQITAPLERITVAARKVAGGDFAQQVEVKSKDELAALAEAFNTMASSLARNEQQRKQLLSDIAHELKTPLSIVQGNLEGMIDGVVETTPERLSSLREEVMLLNRLVTDLRDISVAEAGQLRLNAEPVDVAEIVRTAASAVRTEAEDRGIRLEVELEQAPLGVVADADRVAQVLRNLLANALRYTPAGGTIAVSAASHQPSAISYQSSLITHDSSLITHDSSLITHHSSLSTHHSSPTTQDSSPYVLVTVRDTGSGIPAADLPHIFDRFYRVDKSRTRSSGGTGLGLSVAKQLVEAHGGTIWAESEPGRGTVFHFTLPAHVGQQG